MRRRQFLNFSGVLTGTVYAQTVDARKDVPVPGYQNKARDYIARFVRNREDVSDWLAARAFPFDKYDPQLGYLHRNRRFREGKEDSNCTYTYDPD
jgi:hypothetical protein